VEVETYLSSIADLDALTDALKAFLFQRFQFLEERWQMHHTASADDVELA